LPESIKWYERSYHQGTRSTLSELAYVHRYAREAPWFDTKRSFELLQLCAPYKNAFCQYWLARAYQEGAGTARDYTKAYAHYTVAKELGRQDASANLQKLDDFLEPAIRPVQQSWPRAFWRTSNRYRASSGYKRRRLRPQALLSGRTRPRDRHHLDRQLIVLMARNHSST